MSYRTIYDCIQTRDFVQAESILNQMPSRTDKWHFFYSQLLLKKAWFSSARAHLEQAIALNPNETLYTQTLAKLMGRNQYYSDGYQNTRRNRRNHCLCCCDCCDCCDCDISCCDLICLDSCCECMGGDLIECI